MKLVSKSGLSNRQTTEILIVDDNAQNVQLLSEIFVLQAFTESRGEFARVYSTFQDSAVAV